MDYLATLGPWATAAATVIIIGVVVRLSGVIRYVPNDKVAVVEKLWSFRGSIQSGLIALQGEAGYQPDVLRGGFEIFFPFQYRLHIMPLVTIEQGKIGYLFARDGTPLPPSQTLASNETASNFQDVREFLASGGQRGPQRKILREGTYAINLAQFVIITHDHVHGIDIEDSKLALFEKARELLEQRAGFEPVVIKDEDDKVGVVTVHDGPSLASGQIIAPIVGENPADKVRFHNNFQEAEAFMHAGGFRGRQYQVLVEGTYFINRLFATVERLNKTTIEVGFAGVVVSYTGAKGEDTSGKDYTHGELVREGQRGVWETPLLPGKYAFNTFAGAVIKVPTTNFILKWAQGQSGEHKFDQNLAEVTLITKDAFEPSLPLSVVVSIDYRKAPHVVQRFGDIKKLVEQTLDPMVAAYFKNIAQTKTLIELLQSRAEIQLISSADMKQKFANYNLELHEVLIGTPKGGEQINVILTQLRDRQIAVEQIQTYDRKKDAANAERELREYEARAEKQREITASSLNIQIKENEGKADLAKAKQAALTTVTNAEGDAKSIELRARGDAQRITLTGQADASREKMVGEAKGAAIKSQVDAYGGPQYQLSLEVMARFADAIKEGKLEIVPKILINGGGADAANGNFLQSLFALMLSDKMGLNVVENRPPAAAKG